ncbi:MAG: RDD family protein [Chloroflexi bacterium]|nr:RDD family protein [Chloroflexota bacterium]
MADHPLLEQEYAIDTPESVTFAYEVAGIGNRFIAALIDTALLFAALLLLNLLVFVALGLLGDLAADSLLGDEPPSWLGGLAIALYALLNFAFYWGYYILFEWLWNGQTPGKRFVKIRVLRMDGNPAGFVEVLLRNLVRPVDFLPGGYGLGLLVMLLNEKSRRLGDFAAGTLVIRELADVSLDALAARSTSVAPEVDETLLLTFPEIRRLTSADYELVQETLARLRRGTISQRAVDRLALTIAARLQTDAPQGRGQALRFLQQVAAAYRQLGR